jgi:transposase
MAKRFGKSISEAALGNLIGMLGYKCRTGGRTLIPVKSNFTTMTCSTCGSKTGPRGLGGLAVRSWRCSVCGTVHDRDINSAVVVFKTGLGISLGSGLGNVA